ncbi:MAG: hypothetical protein GC160_05005 [Acidobacteria bacterium]|nr:hypothetical protein [Acidobacteriota bacterium]
MRPQTFLLCLLAFALPAFGQLPPAQPETGPAGKQYFHAKVDVLGPFQPPAHANDSWYDYYIYQPADPKPANAPVVLLTPGYGAWLPDQYRGWIDHMVKMGYTVVWARADQTLFAVWQFIPDVEAAWQDALNRLATGGAFVPPAVDDLGRPLTGLTGHSLGAWIVPAMASRAGRGLTTYPPPKAVISLTPGQGFMLNENFSGILPDTKFVMTQADQDQFFCGETIKKIWNATSQIPNTNRDVLLVQSDSRWIFKLVADHGYPTGLFPLGGVDNLDYHGVWKLSVGALNCGVYGEDCEYAVGDGAPAQVQTGKWSDGVAFKPLVWIEDPSQFQMKANCAQ